MVDRDQQVHQVILVKGEPLVCQDLQDCQDFLELKVMWDQEVSADH